MFVRLVLDCALAEHDFEKAPRLQGSLDTLEHDIFR